MITIFFLLSTKLSKVFLFLEFFNHFNSLSLKSLCNFFFNVFHFGNLKLDSISSNNYLMLISDNKFYLSHESFEFTTFDVIYSLRGMFVVSLITFDCVRLCSKFPHYTFLPPEKIYSIIRSFKKKSVDLHNIPNHLLKMYNSNLVYSSWYYLFNA